MSMGLIELMIFNWGNELTMALRR